MRIGVLFVLLGLTGFLVVSCSDSGSNTVTYRPSTAPHQSSRPGPGPARQQADNRVGGPNRQAGGPNLFRLPMPDGQPVTVQAPAALFFFTTWCGYCKQALPEIQLQSERARARGINVYGIDVNESASLANGYIQQYRPNFPVLLDQDSTVARQYNVGGYPTFVVIDEKGRIVYNGHEVPRNF